MPALFTIDMKVSDNTKEPVLVSVAGDVDVDNWQERLMRGVAELVDMVENMYGKELVEKYLRRRP